MTFAIRYGSFGRTITASKEYEAVTEFTAELRRSRGEDFEALRRIRSPRQARTFSINGETFEVVGLNQTLDRIAYRQKGNRG